jgi:epoxyqueuosine reductase
MTKEELKAHGLRIGFSSVGIASPDAKTHLAFYESWIGRGFHGEMDYLAVHTALKGDVSNLMEGTRSIICVTLDYNQPVEREPGDPKIARYALGRDYHKVMRKKLMALASVLSDAFPDSKHRACVDSAPILEREYAHLAGLGWFGKNTCLIESTRGSWFFIGALLSSVEFEPDKPALGSCGTCTKCIDDCPTEAIVFEDDRWQVDSRRCISYLTIEHRGSFSPEEETMLHGWTFGCDVCQEVCPFNTPRESQPARGAFATEPDLVARRQWPNLERLAVLPSEEWDVLTRSSPVRRAGHEGLMRNARANLEFPE